nr:tRNA pseudouridine(55) synthase TruB [Anaerobiospirillum thomasii]
MAKEEENVQIRCNGRFLGVGYFKKGMLIPRRMMSNLDF